MQLNKCMMNINYDLIDQEDAMLSISQISKLFVLPVQYNRAKLKTLYFDVSSAWRNSGPNFN